jgi:hypothetical protein
VPTPNESGSRRQRVVLMGTMILGTIAAGLAFIYKIAEFIFTLKSDAVQGFADVPVTTYFVVASGWLCLLVWSYLTGQFDGVEDVKCELLELEEAYERRGQ